MTFTEVELRVLGVLIEKSLTQPGGYPLTLNAVVLGANQKQNRDPVASYIEADVAKALHSLEIKNLVRLARPAPGARANRFEHNVLERFRWDRREQAVMAELLLRGRQTAGELRTHGSRMTAFDDLTAAVAVLDGLSKSDPPYVAELPREPGRSANRFRHLLSTDVAAAADSAPFTPVSTDAPDAVVASRQPAAHAATAAEPSGQHAELLSRLIALEARTDELARRMDRLTEDQRANPSQPGQAGDNQGAGRI